MNKSEIAEPISHDEARKLLVNMGGTDNTYLRLCQYVEQQRAIAESQAWISVEEKLPPIGERVMVSIHGIGEGIGHKTRTTGLWNGEGWLRGSLERHGGDQARVIQGKVTDWMPMPAPPKGHTHNTTGKRVSYPRAVCSVCKPPTDNEMDEIPAELGDGETSSGSK